MSTPKSAKRERRVARLHPGVAAFYVQTKSIDEFLAAGSEYDADASQRVKVISDATDGISNYRKITFLGNN